MADITLEQIDARERRKKANWHAKRVGKHHAASFGKMIKNDYEAELLERGVKDSQGNQTPLDREKHRDKYKQQPLAHTKLLNVGDSDDNVKTGYAFK